MENFTQRSKKEHSPQKIKYHISNKNHHWSEEEDHEKLKIKSKARNLSSSLESEQKYTETCGRRSRSIQEAEKQ